MALGFLLSDGSVMIGGDGIGAPTRTLNKRKLPGNRTLTEARAASSSATSSRTAVALAPKTPISSNTGLPGALGPAAPVRVITSPATSLAQARPTLTAAPVIASQLAAEPAAETLNRRRAPGSAEPGAELAAGSAAVAGGAGGDWFAPVGDGSGGDMTEEEYDRGGWLGPRPASSSRPDGGGDGIPKWAAFAAIGVVLVGGVWAFNAGKF